jgi:carboxymethylenebutenolidase
MSFIDDLDFARATRDVLTGVDHVRSLESVDPDRVAVWGYCTGATLACLAAEVDQRLGAAVLFYPSQPVFETPSADRTPVNPLDLLWSISARTLIVYGDADVVMPPPLMSELRRRLEGWGVPHELVTYEGAGHAFCSEAPTMFDQHAADDGWRRACAFLADAIGEGAQRRGPPRSQEMSGEM